MYSSVLRKFALVTFFEGPRLSIGDITETSIGLARHDRLPASTAFVLNSGNVVHVLQHDRVVF